MPKFTVRIQYYGDILVDAHNSTEAAELAVEKYECEDRCMGEGDVRYCLVQPGEINEGFELIKVEKVVPEPIYRGERLD